MDITSIIKKYTSGTKIQDVMMLERAEEEAREATKSSYLREDKESDDEGKVDNEYARILAKYAQPLAEEHPEPAQSERTNTAKGDTLDSIKLVSKLVKDNQAHHVS